MPHRLASAACFTVSAMFVGTVANAQSILPGSSCNPATGLGPGGQPCVELIPTDPNRIADAPTNAEGADRFRRLDITELGQTFECREVTRTDYGTGDGAFLYEDCGAPLAAGEYGNLQPFYGTTGQPVASLPSAPVPPSVSPIVPAPTPVVAAAPVSPLPPVSQIAGTSLAGAPTGFVPLLGIAAPLLATAGAAGAVAVAASAGGGSSTPSTN